MKKLLIAGVALGCAAAVIAQTATSQNIVGYYKVSCPAGQLTHVALNLQTGDAPLSALIGDALPQNSVVNIWDKSLNTYRTATKTRAGWSPDETIALGEAFWVKPAGTGSYDLIIPGEVLTVETNTVAMADSLVATGFYFPVDVAWDSTGIAQQAPQNSVLNIWNGTTYSTYTKTRSGWPAGITLNVNQAFWLNPASAFTWEEPRPFTP